MIIRYYTEGDIPEIKMSGNSIISKDENDLVTLEVQETDSSYRYLSIMAKPQLVLKFSLPAFIEIPLGAWCEFMGQTFTLNDPENIKKHGTRNIEYTMTMGTDEDLLSLYKLRNSVDHRLKFSMCATPREFIQEIVASLNERSAGGWSVGTCIQSTEKTIEFNHSYIDDALQSVADTFGTEWEIVNKAISLRKVEYFKDNPLSLSYGKGNGFMPGVGRTSLSDEKPIKRLYIQGGDRNIDYSKYHSKELLLPKGQSLEYEGRTYKTDDDGYYIERLDVISDAVKEDSLDLSEIYPSRIGTISSVVVVDAEKNFYDIVDSSIPQELNYENYLIEGETMTIIFQDGMLAGKEFECKYIHESVTITNPDGTTTTKAARRFEIVPQEIDGIIMPNSTYAPVANGKYIVFGCSLPDSYVCDNVNKVGASWDMFREGVRYLYEHEEQKFTFTGTLQGLWAKQNWENVGGHLKVGGYILFTDTQFAPTGKLIRITGIKEFLTSPYTPTIEISSSISGVTTSSKMKKIDNVDVLIEEMNKNALSFTKRRFRDAKETIEMLNDLMDAGFDNFTNGINPITVQTMSMLVGDESLQFRFVDRKTDPISEVPPYITYSQENKQMTIPAGILQHMTLGIDQVKATHSPSEYKFWDVAAFTSGRLIDPTKKYYLYVRANRANSNAVFLLSETAHKIDEGNQYYWMLVGVLNSEYEGERSFATLYGFTEVLPGRITTKKIVSPDGTTYFDLVLGEIGGNIKIKAGSSGLTNFSDYSVITDAFNNVNTELNVLGDGISAHSTAINTINNTILTAGWITRADGNTWWAGKTLEDGNTIISYINQNATTTTINSSKINLVGAVTFSMFNSSLQSDFNGKANSSDLGSLAGKNKVSASDLATALQNTLNSKLEQSDLDNDIITFARLGSTIVEGGYIKTSLLNVIKIAAVEGSIAGFKISGNGLTNDPFTNDAYVIFRNDARKSFAGIGGNVLPAATGLRAVARFENEDLNNYWGLGANYAMILSAKNADRNYAFAGSGNGVLNGHIVGCQLNDFTPSSSLNTINLNKGKYVLVRGTYGTLYLPVLSECRTFLGVGNSTPFAFDLYIAAADGASFTLYGYRSSSYGSDCPHMRNPDDYQDMTGGLGMAKGDTAHLMIVYDGRNFNAFIIGNRA